MSELAATRLAEREEGVIKKLIKSGYYLNMSEFIREAVREKLEKMGETKIIMERKMGKAEAKKEILHYLGKKPFAYVSEISEELGIPLDIAFESARELMDEKKVGKANGFV